MRDEFELSLSEAEFLTDADHNAPPPRAGGALKAVIQIDAETGDVVRARPSGILGWEREKRAVESFSGDQ